MKEKLFIAAILLLCLVPAVGMLLPREAETGGNEVLAQPPAFRTAGGQLNADYLPQLMGYVEDNYFGRRELVSAWSAFNQTVLRTSIADNVVLGKDGWLYFGDTLNDYTGAELMTDREIFCAARNLTLIQEFCERQGARFLFVIAPNKNSLYPEHMPELTVSGQRRNAQRLLEQLAVQRVPYVDLFSLFRGQDETLYFTQDSHWNSRGAALAADAIHQALERPTSYFQQSFVPEASHLSDLYDMLHPGGPWRETDQIYAGTLSFAYDAPFRSPNDMTIQTSGGPAAGSLVMFRDSFGMLLYPYLADTWQAALFSRSMPYKMELAAEREADSVVAELVERNLDYLIEDPPLMPSPERAVTREADMADTGTVLLETEPAQSMPGYVLVRGTLPVEPDDNTLVSFFAGDLCWEAFLLEDNGFALYVPETALARDALFVVFATRDGAVSMPASALN